MELLLDGPSASKPAAVEHSHIPVIKPPEVCLYSPSSPEVIPTDENDNQSETDRMSDATGVLRKPDFGVQDGVNLEKRSEIYLKLMYLQALLKNDQPFLLKLFFKKGEWFRFDTASLEGLILFKVDSVRDDLMVDYFKKMAIENFEERIGEFLAKNYIKPDLKESYVRHLSDCKKKYEEMVEPYTSNSIYYGLESIKKALNSLKTKISPLQEQREKQRSDFSDLMEEYKAITSRYQERCVHAPIDTASNIQEIEKKFFDLRSMMHEISNKLYQ